MNFQTVAKCRKARTGNVKVVSVVVVNAHGQCVTYFDVKIIIHEAIRTRERRIQIICKHVV